MMNKSPVESLLADREVMQEIQERWNAQKSFPRLERFADSEARINDYLSNPSPVENRYEVPEAAPEAIILIQGRPSLLIQNGRYEMPDTQVWQGRLQPHQSKIEKAIQSVGRVELLAHPDFEWIGTAWVIDQNIVVTNRHVAQIFAQRRGQNFVFKENLQGRPIGARVDFLEEYKRFEANEVEIEEILWIAESGNQHPDIAFLRLRTHVGLPNPLILSERPIRRGSLIGVIGYPAFDSRNSGAIMAQIFRDIFDVKRFAPGYVTDASENFLFQHDCSTLGGNSGSVILDLETGQAIGLHFSGRFRVANYAVTGRMVKESLARLGSSAVFLRVELEEAERIEDYADRQGYQDDFLGNAFPVSLPELSADLRDDGVIVNDRLRGMSAYALDYTHFSIIMSKSRHLAYYTAVNIDGNQEVSVPRNNRWKIDPRIDRRYQAGNELYQDNALDKGHLVRRLDPVWGERASQANRDTFHYTNAAPQYDRFNQGLWLQLEDYILDNTNNRDLKISVFTGPIFAEQDRLYRGVQIPEEFWKVIAMVNRMGELQVTAYILSQRRFLEDFEFAFGQFKTYQVPVAEVEKATKLQFGRLRDFDPLERIEGIAHQTIRQPEDIIM